MTTLNISIAGPTTVDEFLVPSTPERHLAISQDITDYESFERAFAAAQPEERTYALGGQAFNTAAQLAGQRQYRLAVSTILGSGNDPFVSAALEAYREMNVSLTTFESDAPMARCGYLVDQLGVGKSWYKPPISEEFNTQSFLEKFGSSLHFTNVLFLPAVCPAIALAAEEAVRDAFVVYAPAQTLEEDGLELLDDILYRTGMLVVNKNEADMVLDQFDDANSLDDLFTAYPDMRLITQTLAKDGSSFHQAGADDFYFTMPSQYRVAAPASTAGAGDAFTAVLGVKFREKHAGHNLTPAELEDIADSAHAAASRILRIVPASKYILNAHGQRIREHDNGQRGAA